MPVIVSIHVRLPVDAEAGVDEDRVRAELSSPGQQAVLTEAANAAIQDGRYEIEIVGDTSGQIPAPFGEGTRS